MPAALRVCNRPNGVNIPATATATAKPNQQRRPQQSFDSPVPIELQVHSGHSCSSVPLVAKQGECLSAQLSGVVIHPRG